MHKTDFYYTTTTKKQLYPNYLGSATRILFRHSALFRALSAVKLQAAMSLFTTSTQVNFGLPLVLLAPSTCIVSLRLTGAVIGLRCTCPNHLNRLSLILSPIGATPKLPRMNSFLILSFLVLPLSHLNILISATLVLCMCCLLAAQHSAP